MLDKIYHRLLDIVSELLIWDNIDTDYVLCSHLLEMKEITQAHTGMNIEIRGIMDE